MTTTGGSGGARPGGARPAGPTGTPLSVLVCRGCCCGTGKHPGVDHKAQEARLRAALAEPFARLWVVDCLGTCDRSNVVVVRAGGARTWFGGVLGAGDTEALAGWVSAGAPRPLPTRLAALRFEPERSSSVALRRLSLSPDAIADLGGGAAGGNPDRRRR
jgi:hypothetical protein